jgi:hypothetical protein
MLAPDQRRAKVQALLDQLPAPPRGKQHIPAFTGLLDKIIGLTDRNWKRSDYAKAREQLLKIAEAIDRLSPAARFGLTFVPGAVPARLAETFHLAVGELQRLDSARIEQTRGGKTKGRGPDARAADIADNAADAWAFIAETEPPVVDFYGTGGDHAFHKLIAGLFELAGVEARSAYHARKAAERRADRVVKIASK